MSFCAVESFQRRGLGQELQQLIGDPQTGELDMAVFGQAAADADALINPAIAGLPEDARLDPLLEALAVALARYKLYPQGAPERVRDDNAQALAKLRQIQQGEIALGSPAAPVGNESVRFDAPPPVFGPESFGDW